MCSSDLSAVLVRCSVVSPPLPPPGGTESLAAVVFAVETSEGRATVCLQDLPADRLYKLAGSEWRQLYPEDDVDGVQVAAFDAGRGSFCVEVEDGSAADADPVRGRISDPLLFVRLTPPPGQTPTPTPTEAAAGDVSPGPTAVSPTPRAPNAGTARGEFAGAYAAAWLLGLAVLAALVGLLPALRRR